MTPNPDQLIARWQALGRPPIILQGGAAVITNLELYLAGLAQRRGFLSPDALAQAEEWVAIARQQVELMEALEANKPVQAALL